MEEMMCKECGVIRRVTGFVGKDRVSLSTCGHVRPKRNPDIEAPDGKLEGWDIMLKVVTNGSGQAAVLFQSNVVAIGPTSDNRALAQWVRDFLLED